MKITGVKNDALWLACEQAFPAGTLVEGQEKEEELATTSQWNLNSTSNSPVAPCQVSCEISAKQCEAKTSADVNKHTCKNTCQG